MDKAQIDTSFWCERVRICFTMFVKNPSTLQHLLLFGPPGSGKTTSAAWLAEQIWKTRKGLMCMSMNAADERSLESIRQKVFPFLRVDWRQPSEKAPRFLILDECETLTEAAQLSLQTILDMDPHDVCVILICNSQSRIHPKLRQRLLRVRYDPPKLSSLKQQDLFTQITRGDFRLSTRKDTAESRLWKYMNSHPDSLDEILKDDTVDIQSIVTEIILLGQILNIINKDLLTKINAIYPLLTDGTILYDKVDTVMRDILITFRQSCLSLKFDVD
jgi:DNA polymerase III delta prime subunit